MNVTHVRGLVKRFMLRKTAKGWLDGTYRHCAGYCINHVNAL